MWRRSISWAHIPCSDFFSRYPELFQSLSWAQIPCPDFFSQYPELFSVDIQSAHSLFRFFQAEGVFEDPADCSVYFRCVHNRPIRYKVCHYLYYLSEIKTADILRNECGKGLIWDSREGRCDWGKVSSCTNKPGGEGGGQWRGGEGRGGWERRRWRGGGEGRCDWSKVSSCENKTTFLTWFFDSWEPILYQNTNTNALKE